MDYRSQSQLKELEINRFIWMLIAIVAVVLWAITALASTIFMVLYCKQRRVLSKMKKEIRTNMGK